MKLEDVLPEARKGKRIGRTNTHFRTIEDWAGSLYEEDILAEDWFVEEKEVTLTRSKFMNAASEVLKEIEVERRKPYDLHTITMFKDFINLANKLGL